MNALLLGELECTMLIHTISHYELAADKKVIKWIKLGRASFMHSLIRDCYKALVLRDKGIQRQKWKIRAGPSDSIRKDTAHKTFYFQGVISKCNTHPTPLPPLPSRKKNNPKTNHKFQPASLNFM